MTCVVESGIPSSEAPVIVIAAAVSAAKPWTGCSFTILWPIVRMMRQPPAAVPAAIVTAQRTMIQNGTWSTPFLAFKVGLNHWAQDGAWAGSKAPAPTPTMRAKVMMPTVFWESLEPCEKPIRPAETSCSLPKTLLTMLGRTERRTMSIVRSIMKITPSVNPTKGEMIIGLMSFGQRPTVLPAESVADQMRLFQFRWVRPRTPPQRPPMSAWEELEGMPNHQVMRFQTMPPIRPQAMASCMPSMAICPPAMSM